MNGFVYVDIGYYDRSEYRFALYYEEGNEILKYVSCYGTLIG